MWTLKSFILICCVLLSAPSKSEATEGIQDRALYEAEKTLKFICLNSSCKLSISEQNQQNYLNEIIRCLENQEVFSAITRLLVENNPSLYKLALTHQERALLLSLCIYQYCKNTQLYWSKVSEAVGVLPNLNIFFDAINPSQLGDTGYATYQISPNKILVLQLVGRGNHNHAYLLWHVELKDGKFSAALLDIPYYSEESKSFHNKSEFLARSCFYDFDEARFIVNTNVGDVNGWKEEENTYQIKDNNLTLVKSCIYKKDCKTSFPSDKQKR